MIREAIEMLVDGNSLTQDVAIKVMNEIMEGEATAAQFGAFVTALRIKGETVDEIAGMAQVMRDKSLKVNVSGTILDSVGTGGDSSGSFNISTTTGFVVAGAGIKVAKHGNRAMSGACGSADVLEALGVKIDLSPKSVENCIDSVGFGFMFAQRYHPSMRYAAGPRKEIGIRNVFNILGPLTNPANANCYLMGVADITMAERMAEVLNRLGTRHALVVHGMDGMDEITLSDITHCWQMKEGILSKSIMSPEDLGIKRRSRDSIRVNNPMESAALLRSVLEGKEGPSRDVVLLNASAALVAADAVTTLKDGLELAVESITSREAIKVLDSFIEITQRLD